MSLLDSRVLPKLNGEYTVRVKSYEEITNTKGGYVQVVLQLPDREFTYNLFPSSVDYVTRNLRDQFGIETETTLGELLDKATKTDFKVWISYNQEYNSMNVSFHNNMVVEEEAPDLD